MSLLSSVSKLFFPPTRLVVAKANVEVLQRIKLDQKENNGTNLLTHFPI